MSNLLSVLGILITIATCGPAIALIAYVWHRAQRRNKWSAKLQVERGIIPVKEHAAYARWNHRIDIDREGGAKHTISVTVTNIGREQLAELLMPAYGDGPNVPSDALRPWARANGRTVTASIAEWDRTHSRGRIRVTIDPPVPPAGDCRFEWGYSLPMTFSPCDEYYNWDVATLHYLIGGELRFSPEWSVLYARFSDKTPATRSKLQLTDRRIRWSIKFPEAGQRIRLEFGLSRR